MFLKLVVVSATRRCGLNSHRKSTPLFSQFLLYYCTVDHKGAEMKRSWHGDGNIQNVETGEMCYNTLHKNSNKLLLFFLNAERRKCLGAW